MTCNTLGILVGGGPAPGINGVIGAATIRAINEGFKVLGIYDGFAGLMGSLPLKVKVLETQLVSRFHFQGGSYLRTDRANPVREGKIDAVIEALRQLEVTHLLTIGGDDTASVASAIGREGGLAVVHAPKTIDNDLPLPPGVPTFGFRTACQLGGELVKNLMNDAFATKRWFFVEAMGRKAGHLTLGIGKSAGAPLILVPEVFQEGSHLNRVVDTVVGSILKRRTMGRTDGVLVYAEGLPERLNPEEIENLIGTIPRDEHGNPRWSELDFPGVLKRAVHVRMEELGAQPASITNERIGYVLRCADPIPGDRELTRDLGLAAVGQLLRGNSDCMVAIQGDEQVSISFQDMLDPETGRIRVRLMDPTAYPYRVALHLMIRLVREDLEGESLERLADHTRLNPEGVRAAFNHVIGALDAGEPQHGQSGG